MLFKLISIPTNWTRSPPIGSLNISVTRNASGADALSGEEREMAANTIHSRSWYNIALSTICGVRLRFSCTSRVVEFDTDDPFSGCGCSS